MQTSKKRSLAQKKILIAEDVELNQQLARHMMEAWGVVVDIASNGREALGKVQQWEYDLVLMDIHMPEMDGLEATRQIRQIVVPAKAAVPIVALTANALKGDRERFLEAGMNDYLSKPFNEADLYEIIARNLTDMSPIQFDTQVAIESQHAEPVDVPTTDKLYDLALVYSIAGGDESFVLRMLQLFLDTMPLTLQDMHRETGVENWQQVGKLAHKLKSTVDSMGIVSLKQVIRQIEQNGKKEEETAGIAADVQLVTKVMLECAEQVKKDYRL
ncbi:response regulator [Paraflavitalea pollutisoli]|uniref:response regulator n=1 Tax=Paraflavitalea pollutisoli TaxID=3034143 RepID=UPI0023EAD8F6|nr:response regulator [Paraflavitalea sp. H1-2-19X]